MTTRLIVPAVNMAVSIDEARRAARATGTDLDAEIETCVKGITKYAENIMHRSIINQTWRCTLDKFPDAIKLYFPPIASIDAVKFFDADGNLQVLDPADYLLDNVSEPGYLVPAPGRSWPSTADRINAVMVEYVAGYGPDPESTPAEVKSYILAKVAVHFGQAQDSPFLDSLLDGKRIWGEG